MISGFFVDGCLQNKKLIVEFYGDTYHCNPKNFSDPDKFCSWLKRTVGEQWTRDRKRLAVLYKAGHTVLIVWQSEWDQNRNEQLERIKNAVFKN